MLFLSFCFFSIAWPLLAQIKLSSEYINEKANTISLAVSLKKNDFILSESIDISVDNPNISLSIWNIDQKPIERYEPLFKETKKLLTNRFTITFNATQKAVSSKQSKTNIYLSFYQGSKKKTVQNVFPFIFAQPKKTQKLISIPGDDIEEIMPNIQAKPTQEDTKTFSSRLSNLVAKTESLWIRLLLVLLLGLLMSLTPCIYPMIPITLGILQSRGSKSIGYNFLQSLCYTAGIATTFAILGLLAAFTGQLFGSIMSNPFFIVALALLLSYLGLSMFGFYDMYTPNLCVDLVQAIIKVLYFLFFFLA